MLRHVIWAVVALRNGLSHLQTRARPAGQLLHTHYLSYLQTGALFLILILARITHAKAIRLSHFLRLFWLQVWTWRRQLRSRLVFIGILRFILKLTLSVTLRSMFATMTLMMTMFVMTLALRTLPSIFFLDTLMRLLPPSVSLALPSNVSFHYSIGQPLIQPHTLLLAAASRARHSQNTYGVRHRETQ